MIGVRLARRPWKEIPEASSENRTAEEVRKMSDEKLRHLVRQIMGGMDATSRSIARKNLKMILTRRKGVAWVHLKVRSVIMGEKRVKREVNQEIKRWAYSMKEKEQMMVILETQEITTASKSTTQLLNNTEARAKIARHQHE